MQLYTYIPASLFNNRFTDAWEWKKKMDLTGKIEVGLRSRCRSPRGRKSKSEKITFCTVGTMWACCNNSYPESRVHSRGRRIPLWQKISVQTNRCFRLLLLCSRPTIGLFAFSSPREQQIRGQWYYYRGEEKLFANCRQCPIIPLFPPLKRRPVSKFNLKYCKWEGRKNID